MLHIRRAGPQDVSEISALVQELAAYEKLNHEAVAAEADLLRDGFGEAPRFYAEIAEWGGAVAGIALWFYSYSTFQGRPGIYLEDLFVRPAFRRKGIGKALLVHLAKVAVEERCGRFQWQVLDWNAPSIAFYRELGARPLEDWITMRVAGEALTALAAVDGTPRSV